jgi:hypothetical protein
LFVTGLVPLKTPADVAPTFTAVVAGGVVTITWLTGTTTHTLVMNLDTRSAALTLTQPLVPAPIPTPPPAPSTRYRPPTNGRTP